MTPVEPMEMGRCKAGGNTSVGLGGSSSPGWTGALPPFLMNSDREDTHFLPF